MKYEDSIQAKHLRQHLVNKLRYRGISDEEVLSAINRVYRHSFMTCDNINLAYVNRACTIGEGQTISQPYTVAFQTQLIDIEKNDKVLEIGTGSGYQCAILLEMGAEVYSVERNKFLFDRTSKLFERLNYKPFLFLDDGYHGLPIHSPFDKIIVTAAAYQIPAQLLSQLKIGGKLVMPVGHSLSQKMTLVEKTSYSQYYQTEHGHFVFVPLIRGEIS